MEHEYKKELRMYTLVLYQLSGIQAGIQAGHAWVEYGQECEDKNLYTDWADNHKTVMVMNGGSTITLEDYIESLRQVFGIDVVEFKEPDLGGLTTAATFILPDYVFDSSINIYELEIDVEDMGKYLALRNFMKNFNFHGGR